MQVDIKNAGLTPGSGRSLGHGKPLQYSCLENSMDRGAWQVMVHRVAKSRTRLKLLRTHCIVLGAGDTTETKQTNFSPMKNFIS